VGCTCSYREISDGAALASLRRRGVWQLAVVKLKNGGPELVEQMVQFGLSRLPALVFYRHGAAREWEGEWPDHPATIVAEIAMDTTTNPDSSQKSCDASSHPHTAEEGGLPGERLWTREHHRG
jgi:hypothetical protein